jgi:phosphoribosyl-AMP cyclohydrolase
MENLIGTIKWKDGLVATAVTDAETGRLLTLCYLNEAALRKTLETGLVHVFRRSKGRLMLKGETSGHTQELREVRVDCEGNSLELRVKQNVAGCHAGYLSCYYRRWNASEGVWEVSDERVFDPDEVYRK